MPTPQEHATAIIASAATLDALIASFRELKVDIDAREAAIRKAFPGEVFAKSGQARLADTAHAQMVKPDIGGDQTMSELAASAWSDLADI